MKVWDQAGIKLDRDPWIRSQARICSQPCYQLRYASEINTIVVHNLLEISTCDPFKYIMDNPILIVIPVWENPSEYKGLKTLPEVKNPLDTKPGKMAPKNISYYIFDIK